MPRFGVLSTQYDHWLQVQWKGQYCTCPEDKVFFLDKTDIETVGYRDQIKIKDGCALLRAPETCPAVAVDLYLPPKVKKLIVHTFGRQDSLCFFRQQGHISYAGSELDKDPFV